MEQQLKTYWIVAGSHPTAERQAICNQLKKKIAEKSLCSEVSIFDVPLELKFGTFDNLVRCVDELTKYDVQVEQVVRRIEKQALELDPQSELKVSWQRNILTMEQYIRRFSWDDAKYPRMRTIRENMEIAVTAVHRLDDEIRSKTAHWREIKTQATADVKKQGQSLLQRDLVDVLTPAVITKDQIVDTAHLVTKFVVVPRGGEKDWQNCYEKLDAHVVPRSTKNLKVTDKDGNTLWRVVLFRSSVESFTTAAKSKRFVVRDHIFSESAYQNCVESRSKIEADLGKHESFLVRVCNAALSDAFIAWTHLKAMRCFCEAALRYGVPVNFVAYWLCPASGSAEVKLKKELEKVLVSKESLGGDFGASLSDQLLGDVIPMEEYLPYICITVGVRPDKLR